MEIIKQKLLNFFAYLKKRKLVFFMVFFLIILLFVIAILGKPAPFTLPVASPTIGKTPLNKIPSTLAADPGFLKLEEDLKVLDQDLGNVDLSEPTLTLPSLELNVSF